MDHWSLELAAYRREVAENYATARADGATPEGWAAWRTRRDRLIASHPQSPLPAGRRSPGWHTPFFAHDPAWRVTATLIPAADPAAYDIPHSAEGTTRFVEVGEVAFTLAGARRSLTLLWLKSYGGGLFLPFRDATNSQQTYGGGRYLLDTVKGADLGTDRKGRLVVDFNYAYHPSCAWTDRWSCPLAPPANRLEVAVTAGERSPVR